MHAVLIAGMRKCGSVPAGPVPTAMDLTLDHETGQAARDDGTASRAAGSHTRNLACPPKVSRPCVWRLAAYEHHLLHPGYDQNQV
eukprot:365028-Chlamydomonas_euryale.AAC.10